MNVKYLNSFLVFILLLGIMLPWSAQAQTVISPSDFTYLGMFKVPDDPSGTRFGYSYAELAGRRVGNEIRLFVTGSAVVSGPVTTQDPIYEISYPGTGTSVSSAPRATLIKNWNDIYKDKRLIDPAGQEIVTGGLVWDESLKGLWWAYGASYNVAGRQEPSIGFSSLNDSNGASSAYGPWRTSTSSQKTRGYLMRMSNGKLAVGSPPHSGNANSPVGAWLSEIPVFNPLSTPADVLNSTHVTLQVNDLIAYDNNKYMLRPAAARDTYRISGWNVNYNCSQGSWLHTDPTFNNDGLRFDMISAGTWVQTSTKQGAVFFGQLTDKVAGVNYPGSGLAHMWYGLANAGDCYGQTSESPGTGPHSASTTPWMWLFDPQSWASTKYPVESSAVRLDSLAPTISVPLKEDVYNFGGAYFDQVSGLLFVSERQGDTVSNNYEPRPVIHVFKIGTGTNPPPPPPATLVGDINKDGIVNSLDWSAMNGKWFTSDANADLNKDGIVNSLDFSLLNANWFKTS